MNQRTFLQTESCYLYPQRTFCTDTYLLHFNIPVQKYRNGTMANKVVPANSVQFGDLCIVLEQIAKKKNKDKEKCLDKFLKDFKLKAASIVEEKDSSFFPILRLLVPSLDRERGAYNLKEAKLGGVLVKALSINKDSNDGRKLMNFRSVGTTQEGDFASVAFFVFKHRMSQTSSKMTVGDINDILDKIAFMEAGNKGQMLDELFSHVMTNLTADHFKWFLRIVLKDLKFAMGTTRILSCLHPDAPEHYNTCGNLSKVCEELEDGNARPLEMGIQLFFAISPMLSERLDVTDVSRLPSGNTYQIEEKFDGERFQVHMENGVFEYFSRKGHSFTNTYGKTFDTGLLTPLLKDCFSANVTSFILDGEMMGWHKTNQCFGSKGMAFDVKKITDKSQFRACFCAFDVLFYNGRSLVGAREQGGLVLQERLKLLDHMFTEVPGAILRSKRHIVQQNSDILEALNKAIESQDEGIVVKDTESYYIANRRNAGWYKIKPEYTEGATEDLDLVIIGADEAENKRQGRAKSFLVACADSVGQGAAPHRWLCVGRVATGLSHDERERVCAHLEQNWKTSRQCAPPPSIVLNKIRPDFWILPEHSLVLKVRATELIRSSEFGTSHTLRFPRVVALREDKPVNDIVTLDDFNKLVGNKGSVVKMVKKRINEEQIGEAAPKTRKKRSSGHQVAADFKKVTLSDVQVSSQALRDRKICLVSDDEDCKRDELIRIIETHGGKYVANNGSDTWCCVVGRLTYRARVLIDSQKADVTTTAWLRALPQSPHPCTITPLDMLATKQDTRLHFAREYDAFGDSYSEDIDENALRRCFQRMDNTDPPIYLTTQEMLNLDQELFNGCNPYSFLRACYIHVHSNVSSLLAIQAQMCGAKLCDTNSQKLTHIVVSKKADAESIEGKCTTIVSKEWLEKCFLERKMVEEAEFLTKYQNLF